MTARCSAVCLVLGALALPATATAAIPARAEVARSETTGKLRFVGSGGGAPVARTSPRAFLEDNARAFGVRGSLRRTAAERTIAGGRATRFQQLIGGVPVLGGEFVVGTGPDGGVRYAVGEAQPDPVDTAPALDRETAVRIATARRGDDLASDGERLVIWDPRIVGGPGLDRPVLAWEVALASGAEELDVYVDADRGQVLATVDQRPAAKQRSVCDAANADAQVPCTAPVLAEGGAAPAGEAALAYEYAGATYDYFSSRFGRDSLDGAGLPLKSTVRYCDPTEPCPYTNAYWTGKNQQMVYGDGYAAADDVVGHELAHGLTDFTSGLLYYYQSGAIDESLSDVFGELIDQVTPSAGDAAGDRWLVAENAPGGALRNMADPPEKNDPDRMGSPLWIEPAADLGGVHTNSGVNNKAAFLMTDGGSFNGQTVTGIGPEKTAAIYYLVQTAFLTSGSDYADLGSALGEACGALIGNDGITAADCAEVGKVVAATEMVANDQGVTDQPACGPGNGPAYTWFDDMEDPGPAGQARWIRGTDGTGLPNRWYYPQNPNPVFDATYATSGVTNLWGEDYGSSNGTPEAPGQYSIEMRTGVTVPPGAYFRLRHAYGFDWSPQFYDGGVIEYSADGGPWTDLLPPGSYPGTISTAYANPLEGRPGFGGVSRGYVSASYPIPSGATGPNVRFRFRIGVDEEVGGYGWFVDDVGVHTCGPDTTPPETTLTAGPADGLQTQNPTHDFAFTSDELGSTFRCKVDDTPAVPCSRRRSYTFAEGPHTVTVTATDPSGNADPTPERRQVTVDRAAPDTSFSSAPAEGATVVPGARQIGVASSEGANGTFSCTVDGAGVPCAAAWTTAALAPGPHTLTARATDGAGNADPSPATRSFTVVKPVVRIASAKRKGSRVTLKVRTNFPGRLQLVGKAKKLRVASKTLTVRSARTVTAKLKLSRKAKKALRKRKLRTTFRATFTVAEATPVKATRKLTLKRR